MVSRNPLDRLRRRTLASALATILLNGGLSVAHAQQPDQEEAGTDSDDEEIVVTGTRIRRDDFTSPNATTVVTAEDMENLGITNVADMLAQMPNNVGAVTPESITDNAFFVGQTIANLRGLNTYFGTRTLTLVDSRRFVSTNNGGGVDMNLIPSALVSRIETMTGGASATYGADAMAGAVNVLLDHNLEGTKVDFSYGSTDNGDGDTVDFSLANGAEVLQGRGHVTVAVEHSSRDPINDCTTRDFCRRSMGYFQNGAATSPGFFSPPPPPYAERDDIIFEGQPQYVIADGMRFTNLTTGILMGTEADPQIWTFNEEGTDVVPIYNDLTDEQRALIIENGTTPWNGVSPYGLGSLQYADIPLIPENERNNLYSRFAYELSSGIELTSEFSFSRSESVQIQDSFRNSYNDICLRPDNGYVLRASEALQAQIAARATGPDTANGGFGCFGAPYLGGTFSMPGVVDQSGSGTTVTKDLSGQIDRRNESETDVTRLVLGANGELFSGGTWTWDAYLQYANTDRNQSISDYPTETRQAMAKDAVIDPNTDEIVCRVLASGEVGEAGRDKWRAYFREALGDLENLEATVEDYLTTLSEGCAPINFFGHAMSDAAREYAYASIVEGADIAQRSASISFSGDAWRGIGAGPLAMAAGVDTRRETTKNFTGDDPITARDFTLNYGDAWAGRTTNLEGFVEFELPLLRDKPGADYLMINLANRRTRNKTERLTSDPLSVTRYQSSWKASMVWQPFQIMRVRMTRSSDTRAPAPRELYQTNTAAATASGQNEVDNPFRQDIEETAFVDEVYDRYQVQQGGNADLDEEVSISETFGLVFTPTGGVLEGLQASIDYYETTIQGGIDDVSAPQALQRCYEEVISGLPEQERTHCVNNVVFGPPDPTFDGQEGFEFSNVLTLSSSQENVEPYWSRGIDFSVSYFTQLSGGGTISARFFGTKFLEQSVDLGGEFGRRDVSGQTGSNGLSSLFGSFGTNYSPTPDFSGNMFMTYSRNAFSVTGQLRYIGSGRLNLQDAWIAEGETGYYTNSDGELVVVPYADHLDDTVSDADLPSWATLSVNFGYDFGRSQMALSRFQSLSAYLNITNIGDRVPDFFSGRGAGGVNTTFFSGLGRQYEVGLRMEF